MFSKNTAAIHLQESLLFIFSSKLLSKNSNEFSIERSILGFLSLVWRQLYHISILAQSRTRKNKRDTLYVARALLKRKAFAEAGE